MLIRKLPEKDLPAALQLVWTVFTRFEAPEYTQEGIDVFRDFIDPDTMKRMADAGVLTFWGAFEGERIVGVIAIRGLSHISLLFVDSDHQRKGVARALFEEACKLASSEDVREITVNSSPYALGFYRKLGFSPLSPEQEKQGIRYTPMVYQRPSG
ncbi:MAG: GNAT family N-acetyltransferase [Oscillospiraceae bacterium]|nr:GNAT family N-acetyltransferase [Oscillospiraceae bacterium]